MGIGQLETTRADIYLILLISGSVVAFGAGSAPDNITYTCNAKGIDSITCPLDACNNLAIIYGDDAHRKYCKGQGKQLLSQCQQAQEKMSLLVLYEEVSTGKLIGGKLPVHYKLNCIDNGNTVTRNATVFSAKPVTITEHEQTENIIHGFTLELTKDGAPLTIDTLIHIGDNLTLQMKGSGVVIDPISCSAYPKVSSNEQVVLWEKDNQGGCQIKEAAIIKGSTWSHVNANKPNIKIDFFAFRFTTDAEVVIGCTALVCSGKNAAKCTQTCVEALPTPNPSHTQTTTTQHNRKRRDIVIDGKDDSRKIRSSSVSFSVSGNESLDNSSPGFSVGNVQFMTLGLVLLFVILI